VELWGPLYHLTEMPVRPGDGVLAGRWGWTIRDSYRRSRTIHPFYRREVIFESVRSSEFPKLPSRWYATFSFADLDLARRFRKPGDAIFVVAELIGRTHQADMAWTSAALNGDWADGAKVSTHARHYWRGDIHNPAEWHYEVLASRGIVLGARVD
jgi:hypothetical protein